MPPDSIDTPRPPKRQEPADPLHAALAALLAPLIAPIVREAVADALAEHDAGAPQRPELLTVEQACEALQISRAKLHRLRGEGLPVVHIGDSPRIRLADAIAWIESRSRSADREDGGRDAS